mmetsp:Transcript_40459/g.75143  ORF Transcript_40459/g.75143 Transcript_40459/m.75143 type:complete len:685 (-) Transcript_40459:66-2120(-)
MAAAAVPTSVMADNAKAKSQSLNPASESHTSPSHSSSTGDTSKKTKSWTKALTASLKGDLKSVGSTISSVNLMKRDRCVIDPDSSSWLWKWDIFGGLLLVIVAIMTPFEAGFLEDVAGLVWFNNGVNAYFAIDVILQFFTAFERKTKFGAVWVFQRKAIFWHYVRGWFFVDFVSVIPYGLLLPGSPVGALKVIRMIRLTKLLKLVRGARLVRRWQAEIGFSYRHGSLYLLLVMVLAIAHWLSCILGLIHRLQVDGTKRICEGSMRTWDGPDDCDYSWLTVASAHERLDDQDLSPWDAYLQSLHMAMSMLVHPHSNRPTRPGERLSFIILTLFAGFVWTQVISRSTAIRTSIDRNNLIYHQTMDDINALAREYHLSWETSLKLRKFFMKTRTSTQADTWRALTQRMSPQLRRDTAREINRTWIKRIRFLAKCLKHVGFITDVSQAMHVRMYAERESFGELSEMYVMVEGMAAIHATMRLITPGESWSEDHLILTNPKLLEDNLAVTMTFVEVQVLRKQDFDAILLDHDEPREIMKHTKFKYLLKRGILMVAKEIREKRKQAMKDQNNVEQDGNPTESISESMRDSLQTRMIQRTQSKLLLESKRSSSSLSSASVVSSKNKPNNHAIVETSFSETGTSLDKKFDAFKAEQRRIAEKQDAMEVKLNIILSLLQKAFPEVSKDEIHDI